MKNNEQQLIDRHRLVQAYGYFDLTHASGKMERQFAFFDANLSNFLPEVPYSSYLEMFRLLQLNRRLCFHDTEILANRGLLNAYGWESAWADSLRQKPGIVCAFHTGSYRLINFLLARDGVPFSLVLSGDAYLAEHRKLARRYQELMTHAGIKMDLELIDAAQPKSLLQMARALRKGRSLLVYVDGNTGTQISGQSSRNLVGISFLAQHIKTRQGVASLAYRLELPIYPVTCARRGVQDRSANLDVEYRIHEPILPKAGEGEQNFAHAAMQKLYSILSDFVKQYPAQWEGWLNIHQHLVLPEAADRHTPDGCNADCATFRYHHQQYLLHKPSYRIYRLDWGGYQYCKQDWLRRLKTG